MNANVTPTVERHHSAPPSTTQQSPPVVEPITVTYVQHRNPTPYVAALLLGVGVIGPATAWLLLYADLGPSQQLAVAAAVPALIGLVPVLIATIIGRIRP